MTKRKRARIRRARNLVRRRVAQTGTHIPFAAREWWMGWAQVLRAMPEPEPWAYRDPWALRAARHWHAYHSGSGWWLGDVYDDRHGRLIHARVALGSL